MSRHGKIARLPRHLREQLNRRLQDGETGVRLVEWLNGLPDTQRVVTTEFGGLPINEQNLTAWRQGGFREWLIREETLAQAIELSDTAYEINDSTGDSLADELATVVTARYAALIARWDGEVSDDFKGKLRALRTITGDVVKLRRGAHGAERLALEKERWEAEQAKADGKSQAATQLWPLQGMLLATAFGDIYERRIKETGRAPSELLTFLSQVTPEQARSAGVSEKELHDLVEFGIKVNQGKSSQLKPDENESNQIKPNA